jgi:hypothetical protein
MAQSRRDLGRGIRKLNHSMVSCRLLARSSSAHQARTSRKFFRDNVVADVMPDSKECLPVGIIHVHRHNRREVSSFFRIDFLTRIIFLFGRFRETLKLGTLFGRSRDEGQNHFYRW